MHGKEETLRSCWIDIKNSLAMMKLINYVVNQIVFEVFLFLDLVIDCCSRHE